ncbi:probable phospholipid translocase non-catalytic subunit CRF1 [[Candida] jaroonii]|uniref:Probable phospholipid translocase non-catalytic subunit CRF1 n=1 Tax=[Candida] jaroonii TaxID=467808 RepID=A0ACA9YFQ1_9ASCO|nr:probable phospholipid translocase non-catalytic subunit CRF1 [[Candida] jaroonii]
MNFLRRRTGYNSDSDDDNEPKSSINKSRKPPNTAFRQQRLKAWQPIMTPKSVIPFLFILAIIFAPLGIGILFTTTRVEKISIDYSTCASHDSSYKTIPSKYVNYHLNSNSKDVEFKWKSETHKDDFDDDIPSCHIQFNLPKDLKPPIYLYYQLTNFYQNHRKYVSSYDLEQLKGIAVSKDDLDDDCKPLKFDDDGKIIYPCGLIANSFFNDSISNLTLLNAKTSQDNETYPLSQTGISWNSDVNHKYKKTEYDPEDIVPPPNWYKMFPNGYNKTNLPDLKTWEVFQNWMRTAGLSSFYKLYGVNKHDKLTSGTYEIEIKMNYPVEIFDGTKSIVITTNSIFGGRNLSLGIIYIIVAIVSLALGILFLLQTIIRPRKVGDHDFLQNSNREPTAIREQL